MEPYIVNNNFRLKVIDDSLSIGDYKYVLRTVADSKFKEMLESFSSVFAEHMRQQSVEELSSKLAHAT